MLSAALVIALCGVAYWLGWKHKDNWDWLRALWLKKAHPDVLEPEAPRSSIVEPRLESPTQQAKREQEELLARLNPR
jgi:hypothetical protein